MRVTYSNGSRVPKRFFAQVSQSLHLAFSSPNSHPSSQFPWTVTSRPFPEYDVHTFMPYLPVLKAQDMRHSAPASRSLATWPSQMRTQVVSPKSSTRSLLWTMTQCSSRIRTTISPTSRKPRTRTPGQCGVPTVFESSVSQRSHDDFALQIEKAKKKTCIEKPLLDRERERGKRRFFDQCLQSRCQGERYQESFSSDSQRIIF